MTINMSSISHKLRNIDPSEEAVTDNDKLTSIHTHTQCHTQVLWVHIISTLHWCTLY